MNSQINKICKNTVYLYGNTAFSMLFSLISTRLILNALGSSDFGIFCIVGGAIGMLGFINGAMGGSTQRFINYAEGSGQLSEKKKIVNASIIIHLFISLIALVVFEIAYFIFFNGVLNIPEGRIYAAKWIYQFTVISTLLTIQTTPYNALINAHEDLKFYSIVGAVFTLIKLTIAIIIIYSNYDKLIMYGFLITISSLLNIIIVRIYCHKKYVECTFNPKRYFEKQKAKEMFSFAGYTLLTTATSMFSVYGGNIVINNFFGTTINAAQGVASQISGQLMIFSNNMLMAINPVIGKRAGSKDYNSMIKYALTSSKLSYLILLFFAAPFILEANWIMTLWLKNVPAWAVIFCQLEITRKLLDQFLIGLRNAIIAEGNIKRYTRIQSFLYISPLPVTYLFFAWNFSPIWLYIIWILCLNIFAGYNILKQAKLHCKLKINDFFNQLFFRCMATTIIIFVIGIIPHFLFTDSFIRLITVCLLTTIVFCITGWYIVLTKDEIAIIKNTIPQIKAKFNHK